MCDRMNLNWGKEIEKDGHDVGLERVSKFCFQWQDFEQIRFFWSNGTKLESLFVIFDIGSSTKSRVIAELDSIWIAPNSSLLILL